MTHSRNKGNAFENLICKELRTVAGADAVVRRGKQSHKADEPDVVVAGGVGLVDRLWIECHHGAASIDGKLKQATRDAEADGNARIPVVIWRRTGDRTIKATIRACDFLAVAGVASDSMAPLTLVLSDFLALAVR